MDDEKEMNTNYRWFHKIVAKANHYCIRCHRLILPWTFCYSESNYSKHLCNECHAELFGEAKIKVEC